MLIEQISLMRSQDLKPIFKHQVYFYILATDNWKRFLKYEERKAKKKNNNKIVSKTMNYSLIN